MKTMTKEELQERIRKHHIWLQEGVEGERLILSGYNLSYANLCSADLSYADLCSANLRSANLSYANLRSANLCSADLSYANLCSANLISANLCSANLRSANLSYANLRSANLSYANLCSADLSYANLCSANLISANLCDIKDDLFEILDVATKEIVGLYDALHRGNISGSCYEGECACLVGTIANIRHEKYFALTIALKPNNARPAEIWFLGIQKGDMPTNHPISRITAEWIEEYAKEHNIELPQYKIVSSLEAPELFKEIRE